MLDYGNSHSNSVRTDMIPTAKYIIKGIQNKIQLLCRTVIKDSTISERYLEVPQGQSGISRKFTKFNFRAIARNISRLVTINKLMLTEGFVAGTYGVRGRPSTN